MFLNIVKYKKKVCSVTADSWKRGARPDAWKDSASTGCLSKPTMKARDTVKFIRKVWIYCNYGYTAIIESLHELTEIAQM